MKIIHTSDWHLGKRLEGKTRLPEQEAVLGYLERIVREQKVDAVVIAGDIFDTVNPPADAEALFYSSCLRLSRMCPVIAVAGNHDNPERLSAPDGIAAECGIILGGDLDYRGARPPFEGGEGFVRLRRGGEQVNFALLPYPSRARMSAAGYNCDNDKDYAECVREWLSLCARGFTASDCNITVSHLFMKKGEKESERAGDEVELGTAALLPVDVLPEAHYTALGHIHKPQCVSKSRSVYYSGSPMGYSFDDTGDKFFNLLETSPAGVNMTRIPVEGAKKLVTVTAKDFDECVEFLRANEGNFVRILYDCPKPLSAARFSELRTFDSFTALTNICCLPRAERTVFAVKSDREMFADYYTEHKKKEPSEELLEMFEKAMRGEEI